MNMIRKPFRFGLAAVLTASSSLLLLSPFAKAQQAQQYAANNAIAAGLDQAFVQNQMGLESALVLAPGRTINDARKWFQKAATQGYAPAQVNLAILYLNGWGVPKNYGAALYWLKSAAAQGFPRAHTNLGILYLNGSGVPQDYAEARRYFQFAAKHGETRAMASLGYMADLGLGSEKNQASAAEWYRRAAEAGDSLGQNNLADMYLRGEGVPQNDSFAFSWFRKAAEQGYTGARIKLGFLYLTGRGVAPDPETAYAWILAASLAGDPRGDEYLAPLKAQLDPEQLSHATQRADELRELPRDHLTDVAFLH